MKTLVFILITFLSFSNFSYAEEIPKSQSKELLNVQLYINSFSGIRGTMEVFEDRLTFKPAETKNFIEKSFYSLPNDYYKELSFDFKDVKGIYRRNTFLIFPNNFLVKTKDGKKYKFYSYKRKKVLKIFRNYKNNGL